MKTRINVSKLPKTDEELQDLILDIKSHLDEHSFYGKFCHVHLHRENWDGIPIKKIRVEVFMYPLVIYNDNTLRICVQEDKTEQLELIQSAMWKNILAMTIDRDFTHSLAENTILPRDITSIQFDKVEMYKDKEETVSPWEEIPI